MTRILTSLFCLFLYYQNNAQARITAEISNFENNKGVCRACLFDNSDAFNGRGKPVACVWSYIKNLKSSIVFEGVAKGSYAISVFHDANNNKRFDTNFLGIPTEGYGSSRNRLPFAAAPSFKENAFEVNNNSLVLNIKLRNL